MQRVRGEKEREREDFFMDDDRLGYHEDMEYDVRSGNYAGNYEREKGGEVSRKY